MKYPLVIEVVLFLFKMYTELRRHYGASLKMRAGLSLKFFGLVSFPSLGWFYGLSLFFDARGPEAERSVVPVEPADIVF
jgi:hypothetical protein